MFSTPTKFCSSMPQPAPVNAVAPQDLWQRTCLRESALRILKDHARDGDRYLQATTQRLIAADEAAVA